jgi:hypothetical protein
LSHVYSPLYRHVMYFNVTADCTRPQSAGVARPVDIWYHAYIGYQSHWSQPQSYTLFRFFSAADSALRLISSTSSYTLSILITRNIRVSIDPSLIRSDIAFARPK